MSDSPGNGKMSKRDEARLAAMQDADALFQVVKFPHPNGKTYHLRTMAGQDQGCIAQRTAGEDGESPDPGRFMAVIVQASLCDEDGELLFGPTDIPILAGKPGLWLKPLYAEAMKVNKLGDAELERAEKNSEKTPADSSSSGSPSPSAE